MLEKAFAEGHLESPHKYGDDFGSPDETYISSQFAQPVMIHRYPAAIKAFYMQPDPLDPTKAPLRRRPRPRGLRRNHRRLPARRLLRPAQIPHRATRPPPRRLPVVPRPPPLRQRPPRRIRHGHRTRRSLALRARPRPRNHPLRPHPQQNLPVDSTCILILTKTKDRDDSDTYAYPNSRSGECESYDSDRWLAALFCRHQRHNWPTGDLCVQSLIRENNFG